MRIIPSIIPWVLLKSVDNMSYKEILLNFLFHTEKLYVFIQRDREAKIGKLNLCNCYSIQLWNSNPE